MAPGNSLREEDLEAIKRRAASLAQESGPLPETVANEAERRCPFIKVEQDPEREGTPLVDDVCDVRVQRFSDTPPFGPKDLAVCDICLKAKALDVQEQVAEFQMSLVQSADEGDGTETDDSTAG